VEPHELSREILRDLGVSFDLKAPDLSALDGDLLIRVLVDAARAEDSRRRTWELVAHTFSRMQWGDLIYRSHGVAELTTLNGWLGPA
jgi:hypothetical protein